MLGIMFGSLYKKYKYPQYSLANDHTVNAIVTIIPNATSSLLAGTQAP